MGEGADRGFWEGQGVSTNLPAPVIDSKIRLPDKSMNEFLNQFGARKFKTTRGYSAEWVAKRLREDDENTATDILKVWSHQSRRAECSRERVRELNKMTDDEVLVALKSLENPSIIRKLGDKQLDVKVRVTTQDTMKSFYKKALIDSGCLSSYISKRFVQENQINTHKLPFPITCYNADGSTNQSGSITEYVEMIMLIRDHIEQIQFSVTNLGKHDLFLGYEWLQKHNPTINWRKSKVLLDKYQHWCRRVLGDSEPEDTEGDTEDDPNDLEEEEKLLFINLEEEAWRREEINIRRTQQSDGQSKETIPKEYWSFKETVFDKEMFDKLSPQRPWDHAIELIPGAMLKDCKIYSLSPREQEELDKFLDKHLKSGHIRPSKFSYAAPFFFVKKKDGSL